MVASWCQYKMHWDLLVSLNTILREAQTRVSLCCEQNGLFPSFPPLEEKVLTFLHRVRTVPKGWGSCSLGTFPWGTH